MYKYYFWIDIDDDDYNDDWEDEIYNDQGL